MMRWVSRHRRGLCGTVATAEAFMALGLVGAVECGRIAPVYGAWLALACIALCIVLGWLADGGGKADG